MVLVYHNRRFACRRCQTGHRTTQCTHTNRPVDEIRDKGRPVTQCSHCREKRQMGVGHSHHRCRCGDKPPSDVRLKVQVEFESGLVLRFEVTSHADIVALKTQVESKAPFVIHVSGHHRAASRDRTKKTKALASKASQLSPSSAEASENVLELVATGVQIDEDTTPTKDGKPSGMSTDILAVMDNPCLCHYGGTCICSEMSQAQYSRLKTSGLPSLDSGADSGETNSKRAHGSKLTTDRVIMPSTSTVDSPASLIADEVHAEHPNTANARTENCISDDSSLQRTLSQSSLLLPCLSNMSMSSSPQAQHHDHHPVGLRKNTSISEYIRTE